MFNINKRVVKNILKLKMEDNFYINLPSNVITHKYSSENSIANFTTKLPAHLSLDGKWEVGLVEMSYTLSWYNIPVRQKLEIWYLDKTASEFQTIKTELYLERGNYNTIDELISAINTVALGFNKTNSNNIQTPQLTIDTTTRTVTIKNGLKDNKRVFLLLDKELSRILGFDYYKQLHFVQYVLFIYKFIESGKVDTELNNKLLIMINSDDTPVVEKTEKPKDDDMFSDNTKIKKPKLNKRIDAINNKVTLFKSEQPYDLSGGYHSLFVYCNIVKPSFVGNTYTQLLRLVEIPSDKKFGDQVLITYPNTYNIPLLTQEFETIEIDIKAETGESMPFEFGRSIITLHFKRKS